MSLSLHCVYISMVWVMSNPPVGLTSWFLSISCCISSAVKALSASWTEPVMAEDAGLTRGSLSHSASEHSEVTFDWVVELESLRLVSALRTGGGGGNSSSEAGSGPRALTLE